MKNTGIIFYGLDKETTLNQAYELAIDHMAVSSSMAKAGIRKYVFSNTYPNFLCLKKSEDKNEISIEESRGITGFLSQTRSITGNRAVIIENSEDMSRNAANSILKILEEPPQDTILILTTSRLFSVLPTIRSRCLKRTVRSDTLTLSSVHNPRIYVKSVLKNTDHEIIEKTISFIESGCESFIEFGTQNAEDVVDIIDIAITYCSFLCFKTSNPTFAELVLNLQEFSHLTKHTYPDKQAFLIAVSSILNQALLKVT